MALLVLLLLAGAGAAHAQAPWIDPADDEQHLGPPRPLFWTLEQKVAGFRNYDKVFPARDVFAGDSPYPLPADKRDLDRVEFASGGKTLTVVDYFIQSNIAGLLVLKDGKVVYERYGLGNTADTRWVSYSVAKSVTSLLVGAAVQDGYIRSLDEKVTDYLPRLKGSSYDQASIRDLMRMSSGVEWDETYDDPESDVNIDDWSTLALEAHLRHKPRVAEPGAVFNYNTAETNLVGTVLRAAIGNNQATWHIHRPAYPWSWRKPYRPHWQQAWMNKTKESMVTVNVRDASCAALEVTALDEGRPALSLRRARAVEIVVDASRSMWGQIDGRGQDDQSPRKSAGCLALASRRLEPGRRRAYGNASAADANDCSDSALLVPFGNNNPRAHP